MLLENDQIIELLSNVRKASRNNIQCDCPFCGKPHHMYVQLKTDKLDKYGVNKSFNFDCKKCGEHGRAYKLLEQLGATHLIQGQLVDINKELDVALIDTFQSEVEEELSLDIDTIPMIKGFNRVFEDQYLSSRGFTDFEFEKYVVGYDELSFKLENYVMIMITRDNEVKGYLARTTLPSKEIKKIEAEYKRQGLKKQYPRYRNSITIFTRLLGGYDEITFLTSTVILVEGFFDKVRVDQILDLDSQQDIKCCFTFGKKISIEQIMLLLRKGVENVILIYDPDAVNDMKKIGFLLKKHMKTVLVGYTVDKDLGDSDEDDVAYVMSNLQDPYEFSLNKVQILQL